MVGSMRQFAVLVCINVLITSVHLSNAEMSCSATFNEMVGQIDYTRTSYDHLHCIWKIQNAGIQEAVALISIQEIHLGQCSEYAKISDGNATEAYYHHGCGSFAPKILPEVHFGLLKSISVRVYTELRGSRVKLKFAIFKKGLTSAIQLLGWNVTISQADTSSFTIQWTSLDVNVNRSAEFYIIEVKSAQGNSVTMETKPGNATSAEVKGLRPSTNYRVVVFGVDETGQLYKSLENVVNTIEVHCGARPSKSRIVGGTVAKVNSWPWQVMLTDSYGHQYCGGALVDPYWVVSAAHCVEGKSPSRIKIRLGAHYRTNGSVGTEQDIAVAKIIMHEKFNTPFRYSNDITLINLARPAYLGVGVGLVCLAGSSQQLPFDNINKKCWITGWGTLAYWGSFPNTLMQAAVPLVSKQRCLTSYPGEIDDSMLCAGFDEGGVDSCQGDSGGPLVCEFNGTWHLEGVTSWGNGCAKPRKYGIYAKVRHFKSWLSSNMYSNVSSKNDSSASGCSTTLNQMFGQIDYEYTSVNFSYLHCIWKIQNAGIQEAVALISVQEIHLSDCSEYTRITDGNNTDVLYHDGCGSFAPEIITDLHFGLLKNIAVEVHTKGFHSRVKIKFAILKKGLTSVILVSGWNVTITQANSSRFTLQWTRLDVNFNHTAKFYIIEVKSTHGILLRLETVPGNATTTEIRGLMPLTKYNVAVFGVDETGQAYKSLESIVTTIKALCGIRPSENRIVGGTVAKVNSWPWQVMLTNSYGRQFCGGSLVDPNWVVTAAHCVIRKSPSSIKIRLGAHYRVNGSVGTEQDIDVAKILMHQNFDTRRYSNDIALIKLVRPAYLGVGVGLVCLADSNHQLSLDNVNKKCWTTGWGSLSYGGSSPNTLMQAPVPLVSKQRCSNAYPGYIDDSMICAGFDEGGIGPCHGDSGGPLVCEFNGTWHLEGVTSWGYRCAEKYAMFANVRHFMAWLLSNMYTSVVPPTISPQNQSSSALVWCTFDHGLCSGWNQSSSDDFDWILATGSTPSSSTGPSSGQGGSGNYMYIESSSPRIPGENANLVITVPNSGQRSCLTFYYHMYGASAGTLNVYSGNNKVFNVSGNQGNGWKIVDKSISLQGEITFEGVVGSSFTGDIAIDEVKINEGKCPFSCHFDDGLCVGWSQSTSDVFNWTLNAGSTTSFDTGPSSGHGGSGKYMYTEATGRDTGDNAKLQVAVPTSESPSCMVFYYHMYGWSMGTLNVYSGNVKIFTKSGDQGNVWKKVKTTLHPTDVVTFEGIRGSSYASDIAIDDVTIEEGNCPGCGGILNKSSGEVDFSKTGDEGKLHCNWTIGDAGIKPAVVTFSLQDIQFGNCSEEYVRILHADGTEIYRQDGCQSSLPRGTALEILMGISNHLILETVLESNWSAITIQYDIVNKSLNSAQPVHSWNITVESVTSSTALVLWSNFPLSAPISHFLVKFLENSNGVSTLFQASSSSNAFFTNHLKGYTLYDVQVLAVMISIGNSTYASSIVSITTPEGVPSRAPKNVRVTNKNVNELLVAWDPLPLQYVNGRLLGYSIYYRDIIYNSLERNVNTSDPNTTHALLTGFMGGQRYWISVAAYTSKGQGPRSPAVNIIKGCEGYVNQSFGWLNFTTVTSYEYLNCSVHILNAGIAQGAALISFQDTNLWSCSEFIKVFDGKGSEVFAHRGCNSISPGLSVEVPFAGGPSIKLAVQLYYRFSFVRAWYIILNENSTTVANWNVSIGNTTQTSITIYWPDLASILDKPVLHYLVRIKDTNGSIVNSNIVTGNVTSVKFGKLSPYRKYHLSVVGISDNGDVYRSPEVTAWTEEGVPSRAPSITNITNVRSTEITIHWKPLPEQYVNGRLLGYIIAYRDYSSWNVGIVNVTNPNTTSTTLAGLNPRERYVIRLFAYTSKGIGPYSYAIITTAFEYTINQLSGLIVAADQNYYSDLYYYWTIGNVGVTNAVALFVIQKLDLGYCREYIKIFDGNGMVQFYQTGCRSSSKRSLVEVPFSKSSNITVNIVLARYHYSTVRIKFAVLKNGLESALPVANWSLSTLNTTQTSITAHWSDLTPIINQQVLYYFGLIKSPNGTILKGDVVPGNTSLTVVHGLSPYREYALSIFGVNESGQAYKGAEITAWTKEGVPSRAPSNIVISNVGSTEITVRWNPLPQQYVNGRLLGYRVYFQKYSYYSVSSNASSVDVTYPNATSVTLTELNPGQRYRIYVSAFTSKGEGPRSYGYQVTTACQVTVNQTAGFIDVTQSDYYTLYCYWTIGNVGLTKAVALFLIHRLDLSYYSEYVKIFDGNGTVQFYQTGCLPSNDTSLIEIPFEKSSNIAVNIRLSERNSLVKVQFLVLGTSLDSATVPPGWKVSVGNTTSSSLLLHWKDLTSILNRQVRHYIILLNRTDGNALAHKITDGKRLNAEISGLYFLTTYRVQVFGVDELGETYKTLKISATTKNITCGYRPSSSRIVGGTIAPVNSWPWQVMLLNRYGSQFCGGSLIDPLWVVTAAHCIIGDSPSDVTVRLGAHYRSYGTVGTEQDIDVEKIILHGDYYTPNRWSNDIALLRLSKSAKLGKGAGLVCLPETNFDLPFDNLDKKCWITGWGRLSYPSPGTTPNELMQVAIPLVSKQRCNASYPGLIDDSMICVGKDEGGVGACLGDSGGPLVCEFGGKWYLEGVTSWVGLPCADPLKYSVYANTRHLKSWIKSKMADVPIPSLTSCDFDQGLCPDWHQSTSDVFNWTRQSGSTPSSDTGPSQDHTTGSGYYMYIETSPQYAGDNANLVLSVPGNGQLSCLRFYYHMYGDTMGNLTVYSGDHVVFNKSGDQGNYWRKAEIIIYLNENVTFEGIAGSSYTGDLAIDDVSISSGSCFRQTTSYPTTPTSDPTLSTQSTHASSSPSPDTPRTPPVNGEKESVLLKIEGLDMEKWEKDMEDTFRSKVAEMATDYCATDGTRCQLAPPSSRRRRSSDNMVFTEYMVHILPSYPKESPDNPQITLLAFFLQMPQGFSFDVVHRDVLEDIVKSDMSDIGGSINSTVVSVQPLFATTDAPGGDDQDKDNESKSGLIKGASVAGGVLLLVVIIALVPFRKRSNSRLQSKEPERAVEATANENEGVYESFDEDVTTKQSAMNIAYDNNAYVSVERAVKVKCDNRISPIKNKKAEEHHMQVITHHALVNEGFWHSEENVVTVHREKPTAFKEGKPNASASGSTVDVASTSQDDSEGKEEDTKF